MLPYEWHLRWRRTWVYKSWLWINYRINPRHRYHFLPTGMKPGYFDYDGRINCALAKSVIDFIEIEAYPERTMEEILERVEEEIQSQKESLEQNFVSEKYVQEYETNNRELFALYKWCKENFVYLTDEQDKFYNEEYRTYDMEGKKLFDKEVDDVMVRIVNIRHFMWT